MKTVRYVSVLLCLLLTLSAVPGGAAPARADGADWTGSGTQADPWNVFNADDLRKLADSVNAENPHEGDWFCLRRDIDLKGADWTPIGNHIHTFSGTFLGRHHSITGLSVNGDDVVGLFGYLRGTVRDLSVRGNVSGNKYVGGIAGYNLGTITYCDFDGTVVGDHYVGGICGYIDSTGTIGNCVNRASVTGCRNIGGIVGYSSNMVHHCTNEGAITITVKGDISDIGNDSVEDPEITAYSGNWIGGIAGANFGIISGCLNTEKGVINSGEVYIGGIAGYSGGTNGKIEKCTNRASFTGANFSGGIAGRSEVTITGCLNTGNLDADGHKFVGGIVGAYEGINDINDCTNTGDIKGGFDVGGIVGKTKSTVTGCMNSGTVTASLYNVGGIIGSAYNDISVTVCRNAGDVICTNTSSESCAGGIIGTISNATLIKDCRNTGDVTASNKYAGGIIGRADDAETRIENCRNSGDVKAVGSAGGIAGISYRSISLCVNTGDVTCTGKAAGGIAGDSSDTDSSISLCENSGDVTGVEDVGGIAGRAYNVEKCININNSIEAEKYAGGIVGFMGNDGSTVNQCGSTGTVTVSGDYVGGVVGDIRGGTIKNCYNQGVVWGNEYVGGIAGSMQKDTVKNVICCYCKAPAENGDKAGEYGIDSEAEDVEISASKIRLARCGALIGDRSGTLKLEHNYWWSKCAKRALGWVQDTIPHDSDDDYGWYGVESRFGNKDSFPDWDFKKVWTEYDDPEDGPVYLQWQDTFSVYVPEPDGGDGGEGGVGNTQTGDGLTLVGEGTEEAPYLVFDLFDWRELAAYIKAGGNTAGVYFLQTDTFTADTMLSSNDHPFQGNYNGGGNTLAFFETGVPEEFAPFCDIKNATIRNLHIVGSINTNNRWTAGLAVDAFGTCLIQNCRSSITITSDITTKENGDGTHSAFISVSQGQSDVTFDGCSVDGRFLLADGGKTNYCGGFVGYAKGKVTFNNCVFFPEEFQWGNSQNFCRFADDAAVELNNCFYGENAPGEQGLRARSVAAGKNVSLDFGSPSYEYDAGGIKAYPAGVEYGGTFFSGKDLKVALNISSTIPGAIYDAGDGFLLAGAEGSFSLLMPDSDVTISLGLPQENTPAAVFRATGADTGVLSGLESGAAYKLTGAKAEEFTASGTERELTGVNSGDLIVVRAGGSATYDSDPQTIKIGKAAAPRLTAVQPGNGVPTGSIPTGPEHEISTDGKSFTACAGVSADLAPGTYYVRTAAQGAVLASEPQEIVLDKAFTVEIKPGAHMSRDASSGSEKQDGLDGAMTEVVYTAEAGYCFPAEYTAGAPEGITVRRLSTQKLSVSGTPSGDVTVTLPDAQPVPTVTFRANGAAGSMAAQKVPYGEKTPLNANSFIFDGHAFVCWNTKADGTGKGYADAQEVTLTKDLTLYAIWEETTTKILDVSVDGAPAGGPIPQGDISVTVTFRADPALKSENVRAAVVCLSPEGGLLWSRLAAPEAAEGSNVFLARVKGTGDGAGYLKAILLYSDGWTPLCEAAGYR